LYAKGDQSLLFSAHRIPLQLTESAQNAPGKKAELGARAANVCPLRAQCGPFERSKIVPQVSARAHINSISQYFTAKRTRRIPRSWHSRPIRRLPNGPEDRFEMRMGCRGQQAWLHLIRNRATDAVSLLQTVSQLASLSIANKNVHSPAELLVAICGGEHERTSQPSRPQVQANDQATDGPSRAESLDSAIVASPARALVDVGSPKRQ